MNEDKHTASIDDCFDEDGSDLAASPYLMRPLRSLPTAKKMRDLKARIVSGQDRRASVRQQTEKPASALVSNRPQPVACMVRDIYLYRRPETGRGMRAAVAARYGYRVSVYLFVG